MRRARAYKYFDRSKDDNLDHLMWAFLAALTAAFTSFFEATDNVAIFLFVEGLIIFNFFELDDFTNLPLIKWLFGFFKFFIQLLTSLLSSGAGP